MFICIYTTLYRKLECKKFMAAIWPCNTARNSEDAVKESDVMGMTLEPAEEKELSK